MVVDSKGQPWCMIRVVRQDGTEFLDLCPGPDDDLAVLGVFAFALFPWAKEIYYQGTKLKNPVGVSDEHAESRITL